MICAGKKFFCGAVGEIAGGENVRNGRAGHAGNATALGQMHLNKRPMPSCQFAERMQRLDHSRALGPATARACGEGNDGQLTSFQRGAPY